MYRLRPWSVRNARWLSALYRGLASVLRTFSSLLAFIGHRRLDRPFVAVEKTVKGLLFDSQSCGQCILSYTGMSCPMNCPKQLRNGPCGGVRPNGHCEIDPEMVCVWVLAWDGNQRLHKDEYPIQIVQAPLDHRLIGTSAWLHELGNKSRPINTRAIAGNEV